MTLNGGRYFVVGFCPGNDMTDIHDLERLQLRQGDVVG